MSILLPLYPYGFVLVSDTFLNEATYRLSDTFLGEAIGSLFRFFKIKIPAGGR